MRTQIKTEEEITNMRISGKILHEILDILSEQSLPGVTTKKLDEIAASELKKDPQKLHFWGMTGFRRVYVSLLTMR